MFTRGLTKTAAFRPMKMKTPHANIDPISTRDMLGASTKLPFSQPIARFGSGHHPRGGIKPLSGVRSAQ